MRCARSDSSSARRLDISDLYWLTDDQLERLKPHFAKSDGKPKVDDRRVLSLARNIFIQRIF